jgi:hypothetical protein
LLTNIVLNNFQVLRGEWQRLFQTAIEINELQNEIQAQQLLQNGQQTSVTKKYAQVQQQLAI